MLIEGDDQQRLVPRWALRHCVVDIEEQLLTKCHIVIRVLTVAGGTPRGLRERVRGRLPDVQSDWKSVNNPNWLASALLMSEK